MSTATDPIFDVVQVTVESASKEKRGNNVVWAFRLEVPWSKYAIPTSMPMDWSETDILKGESYQVKLRRGKQITNTSDGSRPYHYFWDIAEWGSSTSASTKAQRPTRSDGTEVFRTKEELRWTEAMHMAVQTASWNIQTNHEAFHDLATLFYAQLSNPPGAQQEPQEPVSGASEPGPGADVGALPQALVPGDMCPEHPASRVSALGNHPVWDDLPGGGRAIVGWCPKGSEPENEEEVF
jgi:hypothetical protein